MNTSRDEDFVEAISENPYFILCRIINPNLLCRIGCPDAFLSCVDLIELTVTAIFLPQATRRFKREGKKTTTMFFHNLQVAQSEAAV